MHHAITSAFALASKLAYVGLAVLREGKKHADRLSENVRTLPNGRVRCDSRVHIEPSVGTIRSNCLAVVLRSKLNLGL